VAVVYIEARPKGRDGDPITHFVVEDHADSVLHRADTQHAAIAWAKANGHSPHVARVRHLSDKRNPDHWRAV
jgi:hypothetical protein